MLWCLAQFNDFGGLIQVVEVAVFPLPGCPGLCVGSSCRGCCCLRGAEGLPRGSVPLGQCWWDAGDATILHLATTSDGRKGKNFQLFLVSLQLPVSGLLNWSVHISQVRQQERFEIMQHLDISWPTGKEGHHWVHWGELFLLLWDILSKKITKKYEKVNSRWIQNKQMQLFLLAVARGSQAFLQAHRSTSNFGNISLLCQHLIPIKYNTHFPGNKHVFQTKEPGGKVWNKTIPNIFQSI